MEVDEEEWGWMRGRQCRGGGVWEGVFVDNCGSLYVNFWHECDDICVRSKGVGVV